jgi:hypothetical protein
VRQADLFPPPRPLAHWIRTTKFDPHAVALANRHYTRRTPGSPQFCPPGQTVVLILPTRSALFAWWRPHPKAGLAAMNGRDGWTCSLFRNESSLLSSALILDAERALEGYSCGPDGLMTYVFDQKLRSTNPGYCFKMAGYRVIGRSADQRKTLLMKPWALRGLGRMPS